MKRPEPSLDKLHMLDERGSRRYLYPAEVSGRFSNLRPLVFAILIAVYVSLPWITVGGQPAVFIDIAARRFFLFGRTFNAQDLYLAFFILTGVGFLLILAAALFGRVWCGWACPQTVFLEGIFRRIERLIEGPASHRQALARGPLTVEKILRKLLLHTVYLLLSYVLAHLLLAYFVSAAQLLRMIKEGPKAHLSTFLWGVGITVALYWNFFWFREQLCLIVCPYGRLQSVMQDRDTIVIGYDKRRGEPRGKVKQEGVGDCVDCRRCVAVCPTDIDIRNGLQMECIGCAGCIDACDEIMVKLGRKKGLIRYDSERALTTGTRKFLRPRMSLYSALGALGLTVATTLFVRHTAFESNFLHARGASYVLDGELVRNQLLVHLINKNATPSVLSLQSLAVEPMTLIIPLPEVPLDSLASIEVPVIASLPRASYRPGMRVSLQVFDRTSQTDRVIDVAFMGPNTEPTSGVPTR